MMQLIHLFILSLAGANTSLPLVEYSLYLQNQFPKLPKVEPAFYRLGNTDTWYCNSTETLDWTSSFVAIKSYLMSANTQSTFFDWRDKKNLAKSIRKKGNNIVIESTRSDGTKHYSECISIGVIKETLVSNGFCANATSVFNMIRTINELLVAREKFQKILKDSVLLKPVQESMEQVKEQLFLIEDDLDGILENPDICHILAKPSK